MRKDFFCKRIELHNHSMESDGTMEVEELADYLASRGIRDFSLTDHNTITGQAKIQDYIKNKNMNCINGYELTSYYGHILCHNVNSYIKWEDIDKNNADILFDRVHLLGGIAGIAHPCSIGSPISNGLRFEMKINNCAVVDFIEIVNNSHDFFPDNQEGISLWESLVFDGYSITPVSGMDLHRPVDMCGYYTTYMHLPISLLHKGLSEQLDFSIRNNLTCVTNGPDMVAIISDVNLNILLMDGLKPVAASYTLNIRTPQIDLNVPIKNATTLLSLTSLKIDIRHPIILRLYEEDLSSKHLCAITMPTSNFTCDL